MSVSTESPTREATNGGGRDRVRELLRTTGLLPAARAARAWQQRLAYLPHNLSYWRGAREELPVPSLALINLVSGQPDIPWFLQGGELAARAIEETLQRQGRSMESLAGVLDFGCGCGRVVRRWNDIADRVAIHGTDLNPRLISWCEANLPFASFVTNGLAPELGYDDDSFELVYSLSVFTHLPEDIQKPWLDELARVTRPGGYVLITTHGDSYADELHGAHRLAYDEGRLAVVLSVDAGSNECGAYHPPSYVREALAADLEVVDFVADGALGNPHQDLWLLQMPASD